MRNNEILLTGVPKAIFDEYDNPFNRAQEIGKNTIFQQGMEYILRCGIAVLSLSGGGRV